MKRLLAVIFVACVSTASLFAQTEMKSSKTAAKPSLLDPASLNQKAPETFKAKFVTTKGDFVVEVHRAWSPLGADRFYNLVKNGFFTNVCLFRVVTGFVVQFGISGDPKIAAAWNDAKIQDDPTGRHSNTAGTLTFATAGPNTRTTQVFINFGDNSRLDSMGFTPFGQIAQGMDVVNRFYSGYGDQPTGMQGQITSEGNDFLKSHFPSLDYIKSAAVVPSGSAAATKKAAPVTKE